MLTTAVATTPIEFGNSRHSGSSHAGEDWRLWCRLCAKEDAQNISVFFKDEQQQNGSGSADGNDTLSGDMSLAAAIAKYFWVNITRDEELPTVLCSDCFSLVTTLVNFSERVAKVQQLYCSLLSTPASSKLDLHALRVRYGLLDEEREQILIEQPLPEVHYFESKPKVVELEEKIFETDAEQPVETVFSNPLAQQPRVRIKIKAEYMMEEQRPQDEEVCDYENDEEYEEDPFNSNVDSDNGNDGIIPVEAASDENDDDHEELKLKRTSPLQRTRKAANTHSAAEEQSKMSPRKRQRRKCNEKVKTGEDEGHQTDAPCATTGKRRPKSNDVDNSADAKETYTCSECTQSFHRAQNYRIHMKRKHNKVAPVPQLHCGECGRAFNTLNQLERHAQKHLPLALKKVMPCPYCEKKFSSNSVQAHIKAVHMNERPFICEECGEAVRNNSALKAHMLTHTDYAPFECEVCKKRFKNQIRLKSHMETHDPNKHICAACGLQLNSRTTLNRHLLVHSDEMQHKCDYCGRAFKRAKALKNHLILHTGLKPYSCDFCDRSFANGSNYRSHKKRSHPEELAALEAAGGSQTCKRNIPTLKALKAVTKTAENLTPVVSKQSGCFAFGRKPKPPPKGLQPKVVKSTKMTLGNDETAPPLSLNALNIAVPASAMMGQNGGGDGSGNVCGGIPTIDNIYSHIMKQATMTADASINIQIKRPSSESSASAALPLVMDAKQHQPHLHPTAPHAQHASQPPTPNATTPAATQHFYSQIMKQENLAHDQSAIQQQQHHALLQQQQQHEDISSIRSPDSQASHITDDHSNASAAHFYNQIRQNVPGPYM